MLKITVGNTRNDTVLAMEPSTECEVTTEKCTRVEAFGGTGTENPEELSIRILFTGGQGQADHHHHNYHHPHDRRLSPDLLLYQRKNSLTANKGPTAAPSPENISEERAKKRQTHLFFVGI